MTKLRKSAKIKGEIGCNNIFWSWVTDNDMRVQQRGLYSGGKAAIKELSLSLRQEFK